MYRNYAVDYDRFLVSFSNKKLEKKKEKKKTNLN